MDEEAAEAVANALGGDSWNSGGGIWLVIFKKPDGSLVVVSDEVVCDYESEEHFERSQPRQQMLLH